MQFNKISLLILLILLVPGLALAAMSSTGYYIYADSVDFGGGVATSSGFATQDSLGGYAVGISSSTNYQIISGFVASESGSLSFDLDAGNVDLGTLSTAGSVATSSIIATVTANSATGYTLSVSGVSGTSLSAVSDGTVDGVGTTEEYGLAVSGANVAFLNDQAIIDSLTLASASTSVSSDQTTLIFKAVRGSGSTPAAYSQTITLNAVANL